MIQYIRQEVSRLKKKFDTKDPFELCRDLKIILLYEPMGNFEGCCKGFIYVRSRKVAITINSDLPKHLLLRFSYSQNLSNVPSDNFNLVDFLFERVELPIQVIPLDSQLRGLCFSSLDRHSVRPFICALRYRSALSNRMISAECFI